MVLAEIQHSPMYSVVSIRLTTDARTAEKGDAHRDVIMARTGETYLIKAEAQVRSGNFRMLSLPSTSSVHVPNGKMVKTRILHRWFYGFLEKRRR